MNKKLLILFGLILVATMLIGASALKNIPSCALQPCTKLCPGMGAACLGTNPVPGIPGSGNDVICGSDTRDVIDAKGGKDLVCGWKGNDDIQCGPGEDNCWGGPGNDIVRGGLGHDHIEGGEGTDTLDGGPGVDACVDTIAGTTYYNCP